MNNNVQAIGHATSASLSGRAPSGYVINPSVGPMHMPGPTVYILGYYIQPALPAMQSMHLQGRMAQAVGYTANHVAYPII